MAVRVLFSWLAKTGVTTGNPAIEIDMPREEHRLPRQILTAREAETVLCCPNVRCLTGIRDRAILETLYSTGIRRCELIKLQLHDLNREDGLTH